MPAGNLITVSIDPDDPIAAGGLQLIARMMFTRTGLVQRGRNRQSAILCLVPADLESTHGAMCFRCPIYGWSAAIQRGSRTGLRRRIEHRWRKRYDDIGAPRLHPGVVKFHFRRFNRWKGHQLNGSIINTRTPLGLGMRKQNCQRPQMEQQHHDKNSES